MQKNLKFQRQGPTKINIGQILEKNKAQLDAGSRKDYFDKLTHKEPTLLEACASMQKFLTKCFKIIFSDLFVMVGRKIKRKEGLFILEEWNVLSTLRISLSQAYHFQSV